MVMIDSDGCGWSNNEWPQPPVFNAHTPLKAQKKANQCNVSFNNDEDLHTWYWSNVTSEECDKPLDDF
jgi:hypothetical protein